MQKRVFFCKNENFQSRFFRDFAMKFEKLKKHRESASKTEPESIIKWVCKFFFQNFEMRVIDFFR